MVNKIFLQNSKIKEILNYLYAGKKKDLENILDVQHRCQYRDVLNAKLDNFHLETNNNLLTAICGELGNNTFDHNPGHWHDIAGLYFNWKIEGFVILIDRGKGVRETLSRVRPDIKSDEDALRVAFTERISGRSPEQRGNGLKFVAKIVTEQKWNLYFQSGNGFCEINNGQINFGKTENSVFGCVALLQYKRRGL